MRTGHHQLVNSFPRGNPTIAPLPTPSRFAPRRSSCGRSGGCSWGVHRGQVREDAEPAAERGGVGLRRSPWRCCRATTTVPYSIGIASTALMVQSSCGWSRGRLGRGGAHRSVIYAVESAPAKHRVLLGTLLRRWPAPSAAQRWASSPRGGSTPSCARTRSTSTAGGEASPSGSGLALTATERWTPRRPAGQASKAYVAGHLSPGSEHVAVQYG